MKLWLKVKHLFEQDDGSLPDIFVEGITPDQTVALYEWLMGQCEIYGDPTLWSIESSKIFQSVKFLKLRELSFKAELKSFSARPCSAHCSWCFIA
jgi:hypothetical protein